MNVLIDIFHKVSVVYEKPLLWGSRRLVVFGYVLLAGLLFSCSTKLEPEDQLFTGLKPIKYENYESCDHFSTTQAEVEAALATAPNGALFGSSYYRTPFPYALWIYNACAGSEKAFPKWLSKTFGKEPVLMSNVNPAMRAQVAENVLQNHGYFHSNVDYDIVYGEPKTTKTDTVARPRTAKVQYNVNMGELFRIDTVSYRNFPQETVDLINSTNPLLKAGDPFDVSNLDSERTRIYKLFRNHGYYYYNQSYTSYLADTIQKPGKVQLAVQMVDSLPEDATRKWIMGHVNVNIQRQQMEQLTDSVNRRVLTIHFAGKRPPIRPRIILSDVKLRPGDLFSQDAYEESLNRLASKGIFASAGIEFKKRYNADGTVKTLSDTVKALTRDGQNRSGAGILDMNINCVLDKPYDVTLQANYLGKTSGRMGPGATISFTKRNAFRGGEALSFNLSGNYEFETGSGASTNNSNYSVSGDLTLTLPRLLVPYFICSKRHRWQTTPSTMFTVAYETINRSSFFRRHILSGEMSYTWQSTKQTVHQFSPIIVEYDRMAEMTEDYVDKMTTSPLLWVTMQSYFMTKMKYNYQYSSPTNYRNPIYLSATITEASNILALGYMAAGRSWNEEDKTAFKTPFSQFVKLDVDWRKTWMLDDYSSVVAHVSLGALKCYGNSTYGPFSEYYYVGGANSLRGFSARTIGPGRSFNDNSKFTYLTNVGDMKFVVNLEYRPRLFGSLYGALFVDAGNVWDFDNSDTMTPDDDGYSYLGSYEGRRIDAGKFATDLAVDAGVGIRYDLDFFVLRLDWGFIIHDPRSNSGSGYFNFPGFSKGQSLNFAIGYPF